MILPCKLVPVEYQKYQYGLLYLTVKALQSAAKFEPDPTTPPTKYCHKIPPPNSREGL